MLARAVREAVAEARSEPRVCMDEPATLRLLSPASPHQIEVRINDMSQSGVGLSCSTLLPKGALVHIRIRGTIVAMGEIRHSTKVPGGYRYGVLVHEATDCRNSWESD